jgi:Uma2 family endonuclease
MSTANVPVRPPQPRVPPFPVYQITVEKYHDMIQMGILTEDDQVELLEGWIVPKMPRAPAHDTAIDLAEATLRPLLPSGWRIRIQNAITTGDSEPEPDLAVVEGELRAFASRHPGPHDVGLIIESAESSLATDRVDKGRIYARANIAIYWVINLVDGQVEVYRDPDPQANPAAYRTAHTFLPGQVVPFVLKGNMIAEVPVNDLLP